MIGRNYPTVQVTAWLQHDPQVLAVARRIIQLESTPKEGVSTLPEWMRCRMGWCELNHASSDIPGRAIPSLYELRKLLSPELFDEVDWDAVRRAVTEGEEG
jgi:hypothetical protein